MKIVWMTHRDPDNPSAGGAERSLMELGSRLVARGHEILVFSEGWRGSPTHSNISGMKITRAPVPFSSHLVALTRRLNALGAEVIIEDLGHVLPWGTNLRSHIPGIAFFHHLHSRTLPRQVQWPLSSLLISAEKLYPVVFPSWTFVTESQSSLSDLVELGITPGRIRLIPPGVDTELFKPGRKGIGRVGLIYAGGLRSYKQADHCILALSHLLHSGLDVELTVIGHGPELRRLQAQANVLGVEGRVTFTGRVTDSDLAVAMSEASVNLYPSLSEGWGLTILEAAAAGTPSVGYSVPGVRDAITPGVNGLLCDPSAGPEGLAHSVMTILAASNPWSSSCRQYSLKHTWDRCAESWDSLLRRVSANAGTNL